MMDARTDQSMNELFRRIPTLRGQGLVLKPLTHDDEETLRMLVCSEAVYRFEPTFLYEKRYADISRVIDGLYDECMKESLILGIFQEELFCGLAEFYGFRARVHKISTGYRLSEHCWGQGIATRTLSLMVDYLYGETEIEIITASTLPENKASERVLMKNDFQLVAAGADEDWGYESPLPTDKWIR